MTAPNGWLVTVTVLLLAITTGINTAMIVSLNHRVTRLERTTERRP